jgi:glycosyltransferase involved in cell wall biosynthesis
MRHADIFVLSSLSEGFAIVILEAMASGLPIVATRVGGVPDIITDGVNGYLVEPCNYLEISERILLLLRDQMLSIEMSKNNREKVTIYSWKKVVIKLEKLYCRE